MKQTRNGNAVYCQSGGPTAVINTSLLGAYETFKKNSKGKFFLSHNGIAGLLGEAKLEELTGDKSFLRNRPGAFGGTLRKKLPSDVNDPLAKTVVDCLKENNVTSLFLNGGNDSMDSADKVNNYVKHYGYDCCVMGVPKTVDNDLKLTDHTPGYGTAAKFIANAVLALSIDEYSYIKGKVQIIECMGRDAGYITASAILAKDKGYKPDFIYTPEMIFDLDDFLNKALKVYNDKGHCIVVVSEGIKDKEGKLISDIGVKDDFGNSMLGGVGEFLAQKVREKGASSRAFVPANVGRASSFLLSKTDSDEAYEVGKKAVLEALNETSGFMVGNRRISSNPYKIELTLFPLKDVGGDAKEMDRKYIAESGDNISDAYLEYVRPLIKGEVQTLGKDGLLAID